VHLRNADVDRTLCLGTFDVERRRPRARGFRERDDVAGRVGDLRRRIHVRLAAVQLPEIFVWAPAENARAKSIAGTAMDVRMCGSNGWRIR
jgi:hypothetical protein